MAEVNLTEALANIQANTVIKRRSGLEDLNRILRHNRGSSSLRKNLGDREYSYIFNTLFDVTHDSQSSFLNAKTPTSRSTAANRLSDIAGGLRHAIEAGVSVLKPKTIRNVLDHVTDCLFMTNGSLCDALALDYAKIMRIVFNYQPHVEQMKAPKWDRLASFCGGVINKAQQEAMEENGAIDDHLASIGGTANGLSHRSSRSTLRNASGSQARRSTLRPVAEEMVACLRLLTRVPNAPRQDSATARLWTIIEALKTSAISPRAYLDAFGTINNTLSWMRTEGIRATLKATSHLLRLIKQTWSLKSAAVSQMLITMLLLRPYITHAMASDDRVIVQAEVSGLLRVLEAEYSGRHIHDRNEMRLEDLRLEINRDAHQSGKVATALFTLRPTNSVRAESNWTLVNVLAFFHKTLICGEQSKSSSDQEPNPHDSDTTHRPKKRPRLEDPLSMLLAATSKGTPQERVCALQTLTFVCQLKSFSDRQLRTITDNLTVSCNEDNVGICSWAFLAVASCAAQTNAANCMLNELWSNIWQIGTRSLGNSFTCRAATYALAIMLASRLVTQPVITEFLHGITHTMELTGPSQMSDAATLLFTFTMQTSQQLNPANAIATADSIIGFLAQTLRPSKLEDKQNASSAALYAVTDIVGLTATCLGQTSHTFADSELPVWDSCARAWLSCEEEEAVTSFLLLIPPDDTVLSDHIRSAAANRVTSTAPRLSTQALVLNHQISELGRCREAWQALIHDRARPPTNDAFSMLCKAYLASVCIARCMMFKDTRRQAQLERLTTEAMNTLGEFMTSKRCEAEHTTTFLSISSSACSGLSCSVEGEPQNRTHCETAVCRIIHHTSTKQENTPDFDEDAMDFEESPESQRSANTAAISNVTDVLNDQDVSYGRLTLSVSTRLYATAVLAIEGSEATPSATESASAQVMDLILSLNDDQLLTCRDTITALPRIGLLFTAKDTERLLTYFMEQLMAKYAYKMSEATLSAALDIMQSLIAVWTDDSDHELFSLGLDTYEWFASNALQDDFFSPNVQRRLACLLLDLCQINPDYGRGTDVGTPRTCCFELLRKLPTVAHHTLVDRIPILFSRLVLSEHGNMLTDLQTCLPINQDWQEGMAMRMLYLFNLGAKWSSLLRGCTWLMFDAAGRVEICAAHARQCIDRLAASLPLRHPQKLFTLFASQLTHTWLQTGHTVDTIPWRAFHYTSLHELLRHHRSEITAQLVLRGDELGLSLMQKALKLPTPRDVVKPSYAKCVTYCVAQDVVDSDGLEKPINKLEHRLRDSMGTASEHKMLIKDRLPTIIGYLLLSTQQDTNESMWLQKHSGYEGAGQALETMLKYTRQDDKLPAALEPCFSGGYLVDQLIRLCKRVGETPQDMWGPSSFVLTARMVLDAINESLGSLECCRMIRRLMILVALAGEAATSGFGAEMLILSLRPFVNNSACANDSIGFLEYLFDKCRAYLKSEAALPFTTGAIILLILQMRKYSSTTHDSTTQESQYSATVQIMVEFQTWLVDYLADLTQGPNRTMYASLVEALRYLKLPGNAAVDSPESSLLLFLLDQWASRKPLCSRDDITEAVQILSESFVMPDMAILDCLGKDAMAARYAQPIWEILVAASPSDAFVTWAASIVGRAYAATGVRPDPEMSRKTNVSAEDHGKALVASQIAIVHRVSRLAYSRNRIHAGLAESTLRRMQEVTKNCSTPKEAMDLQDMMPEAIFAAVYEGTYGYQSATATIDRPPSSVSEAALRAALASSDDKSLEQWATELAHTLSSWASQNAILSSLSALFQNVDELAIELLPQMLHILLVKQHDAVSPLLSEAATAHLSSSAPAVLSKQRFLLRLLLHLRSQPFPGEITRADRLQWLDIDYTIAARAAVRCNMPTTALLLAESAGASATQEDRRASKRASVTQEPAQIQPPPDLLLAVYKQIEEPDSFYGVPQEASLSSVLERLDHEENGFKSMMFRSAQMDSQMRALRNLTESNAVGMVQSLSSLNFNSLAFALMTNGLGNASGCSSQMLQTAQSLQQWDITPPSHRSESSTTFDVLQELSRSSNVLQIRNKTKKAMLQFFKTNAAHEPRDLQSHAWHASLSALTEISEILAAVSDHDLAACWTAFSTRHDWMHMAKFDDVKPFLSNRHTVLGVLSQNVPMQQSMHISTKQCRVLEVEALLALSRISREHNKLQEALTATTTMSDMVGTCSHTGLQISSAVSMETALVLWDAGEASMSVKMLHDLNKLNSESIRQDIHVGHAGLLAQLGHESAQARLHKPEQILSEYLKPAVNAAGKSKDQSEIGRVHYEFAKFCDNELQNPSSIENLARITKLRHNKEEEVEAYRQAIRSGKKTTNERQLMTRKMQQAQTWLEIDIAEERRLQKNQSDHVNLSLQNYLQTLAASEKYDICVLRFFALWLENTNGVDQGPDAFVMRYLPKVASWKFVRLMNQLMSHLEESATPFQQALGGLLHRIFIQHPYHSLHHLFALRNMQLSKDPAAMSRLNASVSIMNELQKDPRIATILKNVFTADQLYRVLADNKPEGTQNAKIDVKKIAAAERVYVRVPPLKVPPSTITLRLRPNGGYSDVPVVARFDRTVSIMNGLSAPKMMKLLATNGKYYKELYKSGDDDLRQDAIMEQVFEEVSNMLRNHKATRQRDLKLRTYKVIPLSSGSGIIEFVPNSIPINEFLMPAHKQYHPKDMTSGKARELITRAYASGQGTTADRISAFQKVCANLQPVMRHFFLERFDDPDEWFSKRTAYSRTTASISILGHVIGLGDRHCSNILLDEQTGEIVHIDLGVAFEAGRVLPIPEMIPFRLTRDIVDGMGSTGVEGVFRRCCEFTLEAVREDKDSIMTLLNVLRYDPLHNWTISPLRAKRMQEAQSEMSRNGIEDDSSRRKEQEAGEADRALSIVEKKLSKALSTAAAVNELIQQATDEKHLACLFTGWAAYY
ncbi:Putative serine/threonine-protein kinase ATM, plant [Septoria linicola]|uniref:Serine/threonine-protein kinase Tel1 n=1 Tax=Septoria linicola TaxID=215465 RepID=A0A9Q9AKD3_9PEZI|nr:putative serine/threonine-protein kinase ATM, plant [Septoria linicola]USW49539.1 Putative serine/threonine-protein kinase ATM, plant [Septoria linicola]